MLLPLTFQQIKVVSGPLCLYWSSCLFGFPLQSALCRVKLFLGAAAHKNLPFSRGKTCCKGNLVYQNTLSCFVFVIEVALKREVIISPSLQTPAYILAELSHPGTLQISISAHKAALGKHWTVCNVGARSWLTKPRGPEQPSLPLVGDFLKWVGEKDRVGGQLHPREESQSKVISQTAPEVGGNN